MSNVELAIGFSIPERFERSDLNWWIDVYVGPVGFGVNLLGFYLALKLS